MASPITAVIWDWNGTLLDDVEQARAAMNLVLADLGLPTIVDRPAYRAVFEAITQVPFQLEQWTDKVREVTLDETARQLEIALLVEPVLRKPDESYATAYAARLRLMSIDRQIKDLKSRLQRTNPVEHPNDHKQMFSTLLGYEVTRKQLQQMTIGALD